MQRAILRFVPGRFGFFGSIGALAAVLALSGCPGTLDPTLTKETSGTGGTSATGGSTGTGGTTDPNCTGGNDGATLISSTCATSYCHVPGSDGTTGGLDLTVDANIGSRLVGVMSAGTATNGSDCIGNAEPYLDPGSNPATGLLLDKLTNTPPCGSRMPFVEAALTATQQKCIDEWATTLTSP